MKLYITILASIVCARSLVAQQVEPDVFTLDNGMKFILLQRAEEPNSVAAGWLAKVGSVNERPGITGLSHYFEHLMFKGTDTIGTTDAEADREFTLKESGLRDQMLQIVWGEQYDRYKDGEIDDPWDESNDTPQLAALRKELARTMEEHRSVIIKDEFASVYQKEGAVGMNAFTSEDLTFYINGLPANKLELWCWMESDRLQNSVFREFFSERDVVHEERRMRTESSPTGEFDEQFNSMFWQASPYSWPVIGWPSDLNSYTLEEAQRYFDIYYRPNNLIGILVGDFDIEATKEMIVEYFGPLERGKTEPPPVPTIEPVQRAPQRLVGEVDAQSQVEVRYHAVPFGHADSYALEVMAAVLNGRTGRLFKSMIEGEEIASGARVGFDGKKYAGAFFFSATVKGDAEPEELEAGWYKELELLKSEPVSSLELEKVKNNIVADQYRSLQSNFYLMIQLGFFEMFGGWDYINTISDRLLSVNEEDIMGVANKYFSLNNSSVAVYRRSADAEPLDEDLAGFSPEQLMVLQQALAQINSIPEEGLASALLEIRAQASQVPAEYTAVFEHLVKKLEERISNIDSGDGTGGAGETVEVVPVEEEAETVDQQPELLELTAQQQAEADLFLANIVSMELPDLIRVYTTMQGVANSVPEKDRPVVQFILAKLAVHIAELEQQENN